MGKVSDPCPRDGGTHWQARRIVNKSLNPDSGSRPLASREISNSLATWVSVSSSDLASTLSRLI